MRNGRPKDLAERFPDHDVDLLVQTMMGPYHEDTDHPWHRLERGEISFAEVRAHNKEALARLGIEPPPAGSSAASLAFEPNEEMLALLVDLRTAGLRTGMLTNNIREFRDLWWPLMPWTEMLDDIVDSHEVGMRKPNPAIYSLALERLGTTAGRTAFLDDVESNVAGARNVGMVGVLVEDDSASAIATVRRLAGLA
jgi:epoxide hydrolase-like predicted phosphatase